MDEYFPTEQILGGLCYLLNKILLSYAEGVGDDRNKLRVWGWAVYLIGLPAWVIILVIKRDWMAVALEVGSIPAVMLGLTIALKGLEQTSELLKGSVKMFAYGLLTAGVAYSLHDFGGITSFTQVLEIGVMSGFLMGSHRLAKKNPNGWLWFMLMNASMGILMAIQGKPILAIQQAVSFYFVARGFYVSRLHLPDSVLTASSTTLKN